jgi:hypothetical protein
LIDAKILSTFKAESLLATQVAQHSPLQFIPHQENKNMKHYIFLWVDVSSRAEDISIQTDFLGLRYPQPLISSARRNAEVVVCHFEFVTAFRITKRA